MKLGSTFKAIKIKFGVELDHLPFIINSEEGRIYINAEFKYDGEFTFSVFS